MAAAAQHPQLVRVPLSTRLAAATPPNPHRHHCLRPHRRHDGGKPRPIRVQGLRETGCAEHTRVSPCCAHQRYLPSAPSVVSAGFSASAVAGAAATAAAETEVRAAAVGAGATACSSLPCAAAPSAFLLEARPCQSEQWPWFAGTRVKLMRLHGQSARAWRYRTCAWSLKAHEWEPQQAEEEELAAHDVKEKKVTWSVVIPTFNRLHILKKCLAALEQQVGYQDLIAEPSDTEAVSSGSGSTSAVSSSSRGRSECDFEVVVVDDGSSDGTVEYLRSEAARAALPHVRLLVQPCNMGATAARNRGVAECVGETVVFIDSDMVVCPRFLASHAEQLRAARQRYNDDRTFTYGRVVNTANFDAPESEPFKISDYSAAFFATGNVAISKRMLLQAGGLLKPLPHARQRQAGAAHASSLHSRPVGRPSSSDTLSEAGVQAAAADADVDVVSAVEWSPSPWSSTADVESKLYSGPFDPDFQRYGWEDLELGERLRQCGARIEQCPDAVGFHWHPAFSLDQVPALVRQEQNRAKNAVLFFRKHPQSLNVRLMLQLTPLHGLLWWLLTLGGLINERSLQPLLQQLVQAGRPGTALGVLVPVLNWRYMQALWEEMDKLRRARAED